MEEFIAKLIQLPLLASKHGADVDRLILYLHILMVALFIGWSTYFVIALVRFRRARNPKADYVGTTSKSSTWIEVGVAGAEMALLFGMAVPFWARAVDKFPSEKESTVIRVISKQFNWMARYPGHDGVFGKQDIKLVSRDNPLGLISLDPVRKEEDPAGLDDVVSPINEIVVPVNKPVIAHISSLDVIHSFKIVPLRVTQDAIPGMSIPVHFIPTITNTYQIHCAQLCGNGHYSMRGYFRVLAPEDYQAWLTAKSAAAQPPISYE